MIIAITALKEGVGKTTTAIHIAAYLQQKAPTLLIDADRNRSALVWSREDKLPFKVVSEAASTRWIKDFTHIITDTKARPEEDDLKDLAEGSDLIIIPTTPKHLDIDATVKAVEFLSEIGANLKVLLTQVDTRTKAGKEARQYLEEAKLPLFKTEIPRLVAFERAPNRGVVIKDYPDSRSQFAWSTYEDVGREILR
ncbi:chromosome partitioning protein ParA [Merismopedia glauca CCAP 1448/3]|uniref:Chromosome partitioning protein ParA n=2 Tax=Merismopedia TaxID=53402 RepID=A0A2T1BX10_9CYAN|nr:chromosome partitioning protein ParA [Merismopedia glauca CCAP 1448/3]